MPPKIKPTKGHFIIKVDLYKCDIIFSFGESDDDLFKFIKGLDIPYEHIKACSFDAATTSAYVYSFPGGAQLVRIKQIPKTCSDHGQLAHEIFHAAFGILKSKDIESIHKDYEEVLAYLIDFITRTVFTSLIPFN